MGVLRLGNLSLGSCEKQVQATEGQPSISAIRKAQPLASLPLLSGARLLEAEQACVAGVTGQSSWAIGVDKKEANSYRDPCYLPMCTSVG